MNMGHPVLSLAKNINITDLKYLLIYVFTGTLDTFWSKVKLMSKNILMGNDSCISLTLKQLGQTILHIKNSKVLKTYLYI